jgi:hypothetical protein
MKQAWSADELAERWALDPTDWEWLANKTGATRLGFAALLKFFQNEGRFPQGPQEVPGAAIDFLAQQVRVPGDAWADYRWEGRTIEYHRAQVRTALGFREATVEDGDALIRWLHDHLVARERNLEILKDSVAARCRVLRIELPSVERVDRLVRSAVAGFEDDFCRGLVERLPVTTQESLDALLLASDSEATRVPLHELRADPGPISIETLEQELAKLARLRALELPPNLFDPLSPKIVQSYRRRVAVEEIHELLRHPSPVALHSWPRSAISAHGNCWTRSATC